MTSAANRSRSEGHTQRTSACWPEQVQGKQRTIMVVSAGSQRQAGTPRAIVAKYMRYRKKINSLENKNRNSPEKAAKSIACRPIVFIFSDLIINRPKSKAMPMTAPICTHHKSLPMMCGIKYGIHNPGQNVKGSFHGIS